MPSKSKGRQRFRALSSIIVDRLSLLENDLAMLVLQQMGNLNSLGWDLNIIHTKFIRILPLMWLFLSALPRFPRYLKAPPVCHRNEWGHVWVCLLFNHCFVFTTVLILLATQVKLAIYIPSSCDAEHCINSKQEWLVKVLRTTAFSLLNECYD